MIIYEKERSYRVTHDFTLRSTQERLIYPTKIDIKIKNKKLISKKLS